MHLGIAAAQLNIVMKLDTILDNQQIILNQLHQLTASRPVEEHHAVEDPITEPMDSREKLLQFCEEMADPRFKENVVRIRTMNYLQQASLKLANRTEETKNMSILQNMLHCIHCFVIYLILFIRMVCIVVHIFLIDMV